MNTILFLLLFTTLSTSMPIYNKSYDDTLLFKPSKYVIVVGCDGMGQMYIENATHFLPNFSYLIKVFNYFDSNI